MVLSKTLSVSFRYQRLPILEHHQRRTLARGHRRNQEALAISGNVEGDNRVNGGAGFGIDGEKRLRRPGVDSTRIKRDWHGIDPSVGAQVEEFFAIPAPAQALRALAGDQETFARDAQRVVAAVERLHINFDLSGFIGQKGQPLAVWRED